MAQLDAEDGGLDLVQTAVGSHHVVVVADLRAVSAQHLHLLGQLRVAGQDHPTVADPAQVLAGEEREATQVSQAARAAAMKGGSGGLGTVFDQTQSVAPGDRLQLLHRGGVPIQVDGHDGSGAGSDGRLDTGRIQRVGLGIDVGKDRRGSRQGRRAGRGHEGEGGADDFVARSHPQGAQGQVQGVGPVADADAELCPVPGCKFGLEGLDFGAQDVVGGSQGAQGGFLDLGLDLGVLGGQFQDGDHRLGYLLSGLRRAAEPLLGPPGFRTSSGH